MISYQIACAAVSALRPAVLGNESAINIIHENRRRCTGALCDSVAVRVVGVGGRAAVKTGQVVLGVVGIISFARFGGQIARCVIGVSLIGIKPVRRRIDRRVVGWKDIGGSISGVEGSVAVLVTKEGLFPVCTTGFLRSGEPI